MISYCYYDSPVGRLILAGSDGTLTRLHFTDSEKNTPMATGSRQETAPFAAAIQQLDEYFAGTRQHFTLPLAPDGTSFQQQVWRELQQIPYGTTCSYGEIAHRIGNPKACRAVGMANNKNPIAIIIPCHRIIGRDGSLTGYGGGLERKRQLLELESGAGQQHNYRRLSQTFVSGKSRAAI